MIILIKMRLNLDFIQEAGKYKSQFFGQEVHRYNDDEWISTIFKKRKIKEEVKSYIDIQYTEYICWIQKEIFCYIGR